MEVYDAIRDLNRNGNRAVEIRKKINILRSFLRSISILQKVAFSLCYQIYTLRICLPISLFLSLFRKRLLFYLHSNIIYLLHLKASSLA